MNLRYDMVRSDTRENGLLTYLDQDDFKRRRKHAQVIKLWINSSSTSNHDSIASHADFDLGPNGAVAC